MSEEQVVENEVAPEQGVEEEQEVEESQEEAQEEGAEGETEESEDSEGVQAENEEELKEELEEAAKQGASKEELQSMVKEYQLKINGKNIVKKIDLSDEEAVKRELQKAYAGQQAMQQKAELEKALTAQVNEWKRDPSKFLEQMGMDPNEWAEMQIQSQIEQMKKDPKELEREQLQEELQKMREQLKSEQERKKEIEMERLQEQAAIELDDEITKALDAHPSLPSSPRVVKQIADTMLWAYDEGYQDVTAEDVLPTVEQEIRKEISELMGELPEQVMEEYIGKKNLDRLRKQRVSKAKKVPATAKSIKKQQSAPKKEEKKQEKRPKRSIEDFLRSR